MKKFKIKRNDTVIVLTGKDRGKTGLVTKILRSEDRVLVTGVNLVKKNSKASPSAPAGIVQKELPIHISNVSLLCPKTKVATKVGLKKTEDGNKIRFARKSGEIISN